MRIFIGLGNPGKEYENTKHNAGFRLADFLAAKNNLAWKENKKFKALVAEGAGIIFVKPQTFMNLSGDAAGAIMSYYKLLPKTLGLLKKSGADLNDCLIVAHDDIDIPLGKYKISPDSRAAGHRGVQDIIDKLKTQKFKRIRIGIKNEKYKMAPTEKQVLMKFDEEEKKIIEKTIEEIAKNPL